ncbi:zinc finger protein 316-like [Amphibalanus amphitrite]|uniref:zinc finger protein 316-like n=1 Tax=Amphibalanus amphitrite TaxID=1232801 RepID=UPI001C92410A|nr:zinc finger protein 316-like [Amphibalanus amphitrite]
MGTEQFSLKWNNHTNHLVDVFGNLLQAESLVDVTLFCEGQSLKAHKLVLSACSPYFKALFQDHVEKHPIVILKDVKFSQLRCIVEFMYKGEVEVEKNELDSLFLTAEELRIKGLAGSRPPVSGIRLRAPTPHPSAATEPATDRKRNRNTDPYDTGGESGGGTEGGVSPVGGPPTAPPCTNGEEGSTVIKRPKLEPVAVEENSTDGLDTGAASGTVYLCRDCGCSFPSPTQLQEHHASAHGATRASTAAAAAGESGVIRVTAPRGRAEDASSAPMAVASHSWPPHDGRERSGGAWNEKERPARLQTYLRSPDMYLPSLVGTGLGGGLLGMMPLLRGRHGLGSSGEGDGRGPLNLSAGEGTGGEASPGATEERSEPSTPTPVEEGGPVTCKVCTRVFETPAALKEHATVHQGERPFKCEYCGKAFKFRHHLKDHCRIHTGERPFDCKICGKSFARSSILKTHTKIHRQEERRFELAAPYLGGGVSGLSSASLTEAPPGPADRPPGGERSDTAAAVGVASSPPPLSPPGGSLDQDPLAIKIEPTELGRSDTEDSNTAQ